MKRSVSAPNSLILIMDPENTSIPILAVGSLVGTNSSCVAVGTSCELDGDTSVELVRRPSVDISTPGTLAKVHETSAHVD